MLQVVDLLNSEDFQTLGVELLSIAPDPPEAWAEAASEYDVPAHSLLLSDAENKVATRYDVMQWAAATGEPGHTFVLVDRGGKIAWIQDYGAIENGGIMYVLPEALIDELQPQL